MRKQMGQTIEALASHVAETRWDAIPAAIRQQAKLVLLDTFGVILAGSEQREVQKLRTQLAPGARAGGAGAAHRPGVSPRQ
jgi:2-methylcitrate dehydratase PrpD